MMKIGIYGGAFNPIHKGHIKLAQFVIDNLGLDKIIFVPSFKGPFKKNVEFLDGQERIKMIEMVLRDKMIVSTFEINRKGVSYTIDTVKYFKNKFQDDELFLIVGSDHLNKLNKWKNIEEITQLAQIVIFKRSNNFSKVNLKKYNCLLMNNDLFLESTSRFLSGELSDVEPQVRKYIGMNKFYFDTIVKNTLTVERYKHVLYAAKFGVELAKHLKLDAKKAYYACLLHDITKEWSIDQQHLFLKEFDFQETSFENYQLHQLTGSLWLKKYFFIDDDELTNAIAKHTTLSLSLTAMDKVVFMADKLCLGRKWPGIQEIRKMCFIDFNRAFALVVAKTQEFNENKGVILTQEQKEIYQKWSKLEV